MSAHTIATLLCNSASACLLFLLIHNLTCCYGSLKKCVDIREHENVTHPETTTPQGTLRGINMVTRNRRKIFGFLGIPYAKPPVGDLRFKAPVPPDAWDGTLDAGKDSEPCIQINDKGKLVGDEDCLYLNAYTPKLPASDNSTLLPVMVYIIGGRFKSGNNSIHGFNPGFLLDEDVLLVVPNFRLGVLGFLSTGDEVSPGNYGLKDMVRVLQWIQGNIQYFGGDPNRVTLVGGSSGAMSVHLLALSRLTDGLFHKYVTQSGSALSNSVNQPKEVCAKRAFQLGEYFGCPTNTSTLLVNCLRGLNATKLVDTYSVFYVWKSYPFTVWLPTTEPDIEGALLTDTPANLYAAGKVRDLPWLATVNRDEGLSYAIPFYDDPDSFENFLKNIDFILPHMFEYKYLVDDVPAYTNALKSYYLNDLSINRTQLLLNFTKLVGDAKFLYPVHNAVKKQLSLAKSSQYFGSFEYRGTHSVVFWYDGVNRHTGIGHGDELIYLFGYHNDLFGDPDAGYTRDDFLMVDTMVQLWTTFASTGIPTTTESISTTIWKPYSFRNNYLRIGNGYETGLEMKHDLHLERIKFWEELSRVSPSSGEFRSPLIRVLPIVLCLFSLLLVF